MNAIIEKDRTYDSFECKSKEELKKLKKYIGKRIKVIYSKGIRCKIGKLEDIREYQNYIVVNRTIISFSNITHIETSPNNETIYSYYRSNKK